MRIATPANRAASATHKSESADGSGVTTATVEVAPPPVVVRSEVESEQTESIQVPSPPARSPRLRLSVTVPPEFIKGPSKSRANNGVPVRSPDDPSHNVVSELIKTGLIVIYVLPTDVVISMLVNVVPLNMNDPDAVAPSLNVTPVNVQRIESAEAMLGRDNRASKSKAENKLRSTSRFITPPSLRRRLTRTLLHSTFHLSALITNRLRMA